MGEEKTINEIRAELGLPPIEGDKTNPSNNSNTYTAHPGMFFDTRSQLWMIQDGENVRPLSGAEVQEMLNPSSKSGSGGGSHSTSSSFNVSELGPNAIAIRQAELAEQARVADASREQAAALARQQQTFSTGERLGSQGFQTGERLGSQAFQSGESSLMRQFNAAQQTQSIENQRDMERARMAFQGENSKLDRGASATQFSLGLIQQQQQQKQQAEKDYQDQRRGLGQDRLAAARQFADVVSMVDPAALPAFYAAGGGNIMNALDNGGSALSENALRPGASSLDSAKQINGQLTDLRPFNVDVQSLQQLMGGFSPWLTAAQPTLGAAPAHAFAGGGGGGFAPAATMAGAAAAPANYAAQYGAGTWNPGNANTGFTGSVDAGGNLVATPTAAHGGTFQNRVIAGDAPGGAPGENPELIESAGPIRVTPLSRMPEAGARALFNVLPRAAEGGVFDVGALVPGTPQYADYSGERPDMGRSTQQVRDIRTNVDTSAPLGVGAYNTQFGLLAPSLVQRYFASLQSKYGIPAADVAAESKRYALQGVGIGGVANPAFSL